MRTLALLLALVLAPQAALASVAAFPETALRGDREISAIRVSASAKQLADGRQETVCFYDSNASAMTDDRIDHRDPSGRLIRSVAPELSAAIDVLRRTRTGAALWTHVDQLQNTVDIVVEDDLHDFSESPDPITRRPRRWRVKLLGLTEWEADGSLVPATPDKEFKISLDWELVFRGDNRATAQILAHELLHVVQDVETGLMGRRQKEVAPEWIENVIWDESRKKAKTP